MAQNKQIDSLKTLLKTAKEDTNKVTVLINLSRQVSNLDSSLSLATDAKTLASKIIFKKGLADAYNIIGVVCYSRGDYPNALKNFFASLKIKEEIGDKKSIANSYNNIGNIYYQQGSYTDALKNYIISLKISREIDDKTGVCASYNSIGATYSMQGNYPEALKNHVTCLKLAKEIGNNQIIAYSYNNIGEVYHKQNNYTEALKNFFACLKIMEEMGDKHGITSSFINIGAAHLKLRNYIIAEEYAMKALALTKETGDLENSKQANRLLSEIYATTNRHKEALASYKAYSIAKDSLLNEENTKKIVQMQMKYEFDKKEAIVNQEKKDLKKDMIIGFTILGLIIVVMFLLFAFRSLRVTAKQILLMVGNFFRLFITRPYTKKRGFGK
ncbi:MAG: tetratricopeptide repeat protein [Bacteroidia bacterium]